MSSICPIDAIAWLLSNFSFFIFNPSFLHPNAIAPELTRITFLFCFKRSLMSFENSANHFFLMIIFSSINNEEPIFITII